MKSSQKSERLGKEPIFSLMLKLSIPAIIGMFTQAFYNVVDSIYIGRLSTEALSALSLAFPIQMVLIAISVGTGVGANSLISRFLGQGKLHKANNVAEHLVLISLTYSLLTAIVGYFFADDLIRIFTDTPALIDMGERYLRIIMMGAVAMFIPMNFNHILRGEGNTFVPMLTMLIGAILNMIFDPFLIFGLWIFPKLGVEGAAYATVLSRVISGAFIAKIIFSDKNQIKLKMSEFDFDFSIIKELYSVGMPAMVMQLLASVMIAGMNKIVVGYDTMAIAVVGIFFRLQAFVFMPIFGLTQGFMPLIGYNYGNKKPERMKKAIIYGMGMASFFTISGFCVFQIFPEAMVKLFNSNEKLLEIGSTALRRISLGFPFIGVSIIGSTTFQAIGRGMPSLLLSIMRQLFILLPAMYFLGIFFGLNALWFAFPIAEGFAFVVGIIWLYFVLKKVFAQIEVS